MAFKIFYSWHLSTDSIYNKDFILECIHTAVENLTAFYNNEVEFIVDHDTQQQPGYPNIIETIQRKVIHESDIFIADLSVIGFLGKRAVFNTNVVTELGIAKGAIGDDRIIPIMNVLYGDPRDTKKSIMPFDLAQYRFPIRYKYGKDNSDEEREKAKAGLVEMLQYAIQMIFETENERRKREYHPFDTWKTWDQVADKELNFKQDESLTALFNTINDQLKPQSIVRLLGLSGLGKTRMLLECFRPDNIIGITADTTDKILYANMNECDEHEVIAKIKELVRINNRKIIILDNCPVVLHNSLVRTVCIDASPLTLITINSDPDEDTRDIDATGRTIVIKLKSQDFKPIVRGLLEDNFKLTAEEIDIIVESSNGLPQYAVLMAQNKQAMQQPGNLTSQNLLERLLGPVYTDARKRKVILAASVFHRFGYIKDNANEYKAIALCDAICPLDIPDEEERINYFRRVCEELRKRTILEDVGYSLSFRPTPLALRLAENWWDECTPGKFQSILPVLREQNLVESFCRQFRQLSYIERAQEIVADLCDGVFKLAEVLNTEEGSRIFRSFVYVNPIACTQSLQIAFGSFTKEELEQVDEGRRNLVWALEQLCFKAETFSDAVYVLASFAMAENENIANNAYNQFLQLFHVFLPGTEVNLYERRKVIDTCLATGGDYFALGVAAAIRSLKSDSFLRMSGAIEQHSNQDYQPPFKEVREYWGQSITLLLQIEEQNANYSKQISEALLKSLFSLCVQHAGDLILPAIKKLHTEEKINWLELRNTLKLILRSGKVSDGPVIDELKELLTTLTPTDFASKIQMYVIKPSYDDYRPKNAAAGTPDLNVRVRELATEFLANRTQWPHVLSLLSSGHVAEGINLGLEIAQQCESAETYKAIIDLLVDSILLIEPSQRSTSMFIGLIRGFADKKVVETVFDDLLSDPQKRPFVFALVSNADLPLDYLNRIIDLVESGEYNINALSCFNYGWGLRHLSADDLFSVLDRIKKLDGGLAQAFAIASTMSFDEGTWWQSMKDFQRDLLLKHSSEIIDSFTNTMDFFQWSDTSYRLLKEEDDPKLAKALIDVIIDKCNNWASAYGMSTDFQRIFDIAQEKYFKILWNAVVAVYLNIEQFAAASFHLREFLSAKEDAFRQTEGAIFGGDPSKAAIVFDWVGQNPDINIYWIGEWLPLYGKKEESGSLWHQYALQFINAYGNRPGLLDGIGANLGTFSWTGSVVERYQTMKDMYEELANHQLPEVKSWARYNVAHLTERIEQEKNREIQMDL